MRIKRTTKIGRKVTKKNPYMQAYMKKGALLRSFSPYSVNFSTFPLPRHANIYTYSVLEELVESHVQTALAPQPVHVVMESRYEVV